MHETWYILRFLSASRLFLSKIVQRCLVLPLHYMLFLTLNCCFAPTRVFGDTTMERFPLLPKPQNEDLVSNFDILALLMMMGVAIAFVAFFPTLIRCDSCLPATL